MARTQKPPLGRLIISVIYSHIDGVADGLKYLEKQFGRVECETIDIPYSGGERYSEEMGSQLLRRFFSFEREVERDCLPEVKAFCHKIEQHLGDRIDDFTFRTANIDPGIVTPDNVVIASNREYNHRIYLRDGVYAELALVWSHGKFVRLPWTTDDFCHQESIEFFIRVRNSFEVVGEPEAEAFPS